MRNNARKYAIALGGGISALAVGIALGASRAPLFGWLLVFADAFTLAAILMLSAGVLVWVAGSGFFDILLYGTRRLASLVVPPLGIYRETYYDYKERRGKKERLPVLPSLTAGVAFLGVAILLSVLCAK